MRRARAVLAGTGGYLLLEAVVGLVVLSLAVTAVMSVLAIDTAWSDEQAGDRAATAILDAEEDAIRAAGFPGGTVGTPGSYRLSAGGGLDPAGPYALEITGAYECTGIRRVDVNDRDPAPGGPCPGERRTVLWTLRLTHPAPGAPSGRATTERRLRMGEHTRFSDTFQEPHHP